MRSDTELQRLQEENQRQKTIIEHLRGELLRLVNRNLDLSERLDAYTEVRRRVDVAKHLIDGNVERQRQADLQDDAQLLALLELRMEQEPQKLSPGFTAADLANMLGVSHARLTQLFHSQTIYRSPEAYLDNLRVLAALRLLYQKPYYNIAAVAEEAGFGNVRTLQRRIHEVIGMTPVEFRAMMRRDL